MTRTQSSLQAAAVTDAMFLVGLAPSSLTPVSIAEMHLYAYLGNLVAFNAGVPVSDWGYSFSVTSGGFPFANALEDATENLVCRSIVLADVDGLQRGDNLFDEEMSVLAGIVQSARRRNWLRAALACALQLPHGTVRDAINHSPGMVASLRHRRVSTLLERADLDEIHEEFALIRTVLGPQADDLLQPVVVWLSARVISKGGT